MQSNIHEMYGSICGSKCESGFDWSTFVLTVLSLTGIVNVTLSLPTTGQLYT